MPSTPPMPQAFSSRKRIIHIQLLLYVVYAAVVAIYTSNLTLNYEDWIHYSDFSFEESKRLFLDGYNFHNSRLGATSSYFIGPHAMQIFHVVQPLFVLLACLAASRLATGQWMGNTARSLLTTLLLMIGIPVIQTGIWWFIGNLSWFYPITVAMLFFALYDGIFQGNFRISKMRFACLLPMAFIVGMSNENTSITSVLIYLACGIYWAAFRQKRLTWPYIFLGMVMILGAYFLYSAPGPRHRSETMHWELNLETLLYRSLLSLPNWLYLLICYWRLLLPAGLLLLLCAIRHIRVMTPRTWVLLGAFCIAHGVLLAAPSWGAPRSYTLPQLLLLMMVAEIFYRAMCQGWQKKDILIFGIIFLACASTLLIQQILQAHAQSKLCRQIEGIARQAAREGRRHLTIHTSELDLAPVGKQLSLVPRFIMRTEVAPELPLISLKPDQLEHTDTSVQGDFPYASPSNAGGFNIGRRALNIPMARRFGLESIICVDDRQ